MVWVHVIHVNLTGSLLSGNPVTRFVRKYLFSEVLREPRVNRYSGQVFSPCVAVWGQESGQAHTSPSLLTSRIAPIHGFSFTELLSAQ